MIRSNDVHGAQAPTLQCFLLPDLGVPKYGVQVISRFGSQALEISHLVLR